MTDAWAVERGRRIEPGTFNLCADRQVLVAPGQRCESLADFENNAPPHQQEKPGFAPRLYPVLLNGSVEGWLFRWSEPAYLPQFVGSQPGVCEDPACFCEIVAEVSLEDTLAVGEGDTVTLEFG